MTRPTFLILGAAKAGTTSLFSYLAQHSDIFTPEVKEPRYFAIAGGEHTSWRGPDWMSGLGPKSFVHVWSDYRQLFEGSDSYAAAGEASTLYLYDKNAPRRIAERFPDIKLVAVLRHPVDRAFSHFVMNWQAGVETTASFSEALSLEADRIEDGWSPTYHYATRGLYGEQLVRYKQYFSDDQLLVLLYDDYKQNPIDTVKRVFQWIGVDSRDVDTSRRLNTASRVPPNSAVEKLIGAADPLRRFLKSFLPGCARQAIRKGVENAVYQKPTIEKEDAQRLQKYYDADLMQLQKLINANISHWQQRYAKDD